MSNFDGKEAFEKFRADLPRRFGERAVNSWFLDLECEDLSDECVVLSTGSEFARGEISQRYGRQLKTAWDETVKPVRKMRIVARGQAQEGARRIEKLKESLAQAGFNGALKAAKTPVAAPRAESRSAASGLEDLYSSVDETATFEAFAVDPSNEMAFNAARLVLADGAPADVTYFAGPNGVGKTHLLSAIANEHRRLHGEGRCAYLTYNALQSGTVSAVFSNTVMALQRDLLSKDVVLIDDIHLLASSPRTQTELMNLVNAAQARRTRLVIAGETTPHQLVAAGFSQPLADRLAGGYSVTLAHGDSAHRARVLRKRIEASSSGPRVEDDAVKYVAEAFHSMRAAIGALKQLQLAYREHLEPIGRPEAERALRARAMDARRAPSFDEAAAAVAAAFGLSLEEFRSRGQYQRLVRARHVFVVLCREDLHESFPRIAKYLGRDHTTMMSGYHRGHDLLERDEKLRKLLADVREALGFPPRPTALEGAASPAVSAVRMRAARG